MPQTSFLPDIGGLMYSGYKMIGGLKSYIIKWMGREMKVKKPGLCSYSVGGRGESIKLSMMRLTSGLITYDFNIKPFQ